MLESFSLESLKNRNLRDEVTDFRLSQDGSALFYRSGNRIRRSPRPNAESRDAKELKGSSLRQSGWIDLGRAKDPSRSAGVEADVKEAWRLSGTIFGPRT